MKWFKHHSDANANLKLRIIVRELGVEGYGLYWLLLEFIAQQGENFRIKKEKEWKMAIIVSANIEQEKLEIILSRFGELGLIDKKELSKGNLYIPKLGEYSDEYTKRVQRVSEQYPDNIPLEEKRKEERRKEKKREDKPEYHQSFLENLPEDFITTLLDKYNTTPKGIKDLGEKLHNYCLAKGKKYSNYKAFYLNAAKRDFTEKNDADRERQKKIDESRKAPPSQFAKQLSEKYKVT